MMMPTPNSTTFRMVLMRRALASAASSAAIRAARLAFWRSRFSVPMVARPYKRAIGSLMSEQYPRA